MQHEADDAISMTSDKTEVPRVAVITGAGRRIGRVITLALWRAGYAVVLNSHASRADADKLAAEITDAGGKLALLLVEDLSRLLR